MAWTETEVALIKELSAKGFSGSQISQRLKSDLNVSKTRNAVIGKLHRLGVGLAAKSGESDTAVSTRIRKRRKAEASVKLPEVKSGGGIAFDELNQHSCRWLLDDDTYCGSFSGRKPFCTTHSKRAYAGLKEAS